MDVVCLKEVRKVILVPVLMFYRLDQGLEGQINQVIGKILMQLYLDYAGLFVWETNKER